MTNLVAQRFCLAAAGVLACSEARAQDYTGFAPDLGPPILVVTDVLFAVPLVADTVYVAKRTRPPLVWPILGFVAGAAGTAIGLGFAIPNANTDPRYTVDDNRSLKIALGTVTAVEGVLNLGMATWALTLRRGGRGSNELGPRWALAPFAVPERTGGAKLGMALSLANF